MIGLLLICAAVFVLGIVLRFAGLRIERRAHVRAMEAEHEARWHRENQV